MRVMVNTQKTAPTEYFTIEFTDFTPTTANLSLRWETTAVELSLKHDADAQIMTHLQAALANFTAETFGGPDRFSQEMGGFRHLIDAHRGFNITEEQRQRFVELYLQAADQAGLPTDEPFRHALKSHVDFGSQVATQNSNAKTDAELHSLREVPKWHW